MASLFQKLHQMDPMYMMYETLKRRKDDDKKPGEAPTGGMRKGGKIKAAKMEMKHANFMKKKGAPKKMVKEEMGEATMYRKGGSCKTKKYARGGGVEIRGKTRGKFV